MILLLEFGRGLLLGLGFGAGIALGLPLGWYSVNLLIDRFRGDDETNEPALPGG